MKTKPTLLDLFQHLEKLMKLYLNDAFQLLHTPEAIRSGLDALTFETRHVRQYAKKMEDEWEMQLPFNCNDEKDVDWFYWSRVFNWQRIHSFIIGFVSEQDIDRNWCSTIEKSLTELKEEIEKLHQVLNCINAIMTDPPAFRFKRYYERRKDAYMNLFGSFVPNDELDFYEERYRRLMFESGFMKVSIYAETPQEYQEKAERIWELMLDKDGCPDEVRIGEYIFRYRHKLDDEDLKNMFRYVNVLEKLKALKSENHIGENPIEDSEGVFKAEYSRYPHLYKPVKLNLRSLHKVIKERCIIYIEEEQYWFCLWKVLNDFHLFKSKMTKAKFVALMNKWFPDHHHPCTGEGIHVYRPSYLGKNKVSEWKKTEFETGIKKGKVNINKFESFKYICEKMIESLTPFCEHPDKRLD